MNAPAKQKQNTTVTNQYRVNQYPTTFFIQDGRIKVKANGHMTSEYLDNTIIRLMGH